MGAPACFPEIQSQRNDGEMAQGPTPGPRGSGLRGSGPCPAVRGAQVLPSGGPRPRGSLHCLFLGVTPSPGAGRGERGHAARHLSPALRPGRVRRGCCQDSKLPGRFPPCYSIGRAVTAGPRQWGPRARRAPPLKPRRSRKRRVRIGVGGGSPRSDDNTPLTPPTPHHKQHTALSVLCHVEGKTNARKGDGDFPISVNARTPVWGRLTLGFPFRAESPAAVHTSCPPRGVGERVLEAVPQASDTGGLGWGLGIPFLASSQMRPVWKLL